MTKTVEKYTYAQLLDEVEVLAGVLREEGVRKGDVVIIYSMFLHLTSCLLRSEAGRMDGGLPAPQLPS